MSPHGKLLEKWFIFQNDLLLLTPHDVIHELLTHQQAQPLQNYFIRQHYLGEFNQSACFCAELNDEFLCPQNLQAIPLKKAFNLLDKSWYNIAAKAYSIINWDKNHQYCGRCGHATVHSSTNFERICNHCGLTFFPRISPSILVLIKKGNQVLMSRSYHFSPGVYGLIAGFVEVGESIEEAVHREVKEEVNITIKNLRYVGSQPWPFPDSLMLAFTADYESGELQIDPKEIESANWYTYDNLPGRPSSRLSIGSQLLDQFIAEQQGKSAHGTST